MTTHADPVALIVGASRGLGLGLCREYLERGWTVIGTVRDTSATTGLHALAERHPGRVRIEALEVTDAMQTEALRARLDGQRVDLLFVNAGIANGIDETVTRDTTNEAFTRVLLTNALSPLRVIDACIDLVPEDGVVAAMSSGLGSVSNNTNATWEIYRASKAALNMMLRSYVARRQEKRTVLAVVPGFVRTDMTGPQAPLDVETSVRAVADVIAARAGQPGLTYVNYKNEVLPW